MTDTIRKLKECRNQILLNGKIHEERISEFNALVHIVQEAGYSIELMEDGSLNITPKENILY